MTAPRTGEGVEGYGAHDWARRSDQAKGEGLRTGVGESCPGCWRPVTHTKIPTYMGVPTCECGTAPLFETGIALYSHGLGPVAYRFEITTQESEARNVSRRRAD